MIYLLIAIIFPVGCLFFFLSSLKKRDSMLTKRDQQLSDMLKMNSAQKEKINDQEKVIEEKKRIIDKNNQIIEEKKRIIDENNQAIEKCKNKIAELENQLSDWKDGINVTDEFLEVYNLIQSGEPMIFVHGGAGVGKSTLIKWLMKHGCPCIKLAPTGLAALNIEGSTIHKFFGLPPVSVFPKQNICPVPMNAQNVIHNSKRIIIDEISMVRSDLIDQIHRSLCSIGDSAKPFGGCQMIFIGDLYQLPPVVNDSASSFFKTLNSKCDLVFGWESQWFLDAEVFKNKKPKVVHLTKVFRQNEKLFIDILNDLRRYKNIPQHLNLINSTALGNIGNGTCIVLNNQQADQINRSKIAKIPTPPIRFKAQKTGVFLGYKPTDLPVSDNFELKQFTDVLILYNDPNGYFVNGSAGKIMELSATRAKVRLLNGLDVQVNLKTWESFRIVWNPTRKCFENQCDGRYTQMPLIPSYAITCHKSQGKTLNRANIVFAGNAFCPGQTYVALSRVRNSCDFSISAPLTTADFLEDSRLQYFERQGWI